MITDTIYQKEANWKKKKVTKEFRIISKILEMLPNNRRVLDLGCAEGFLCWLASEAGIDWVVGVDVEPVRIRKAKKYSKGDFFCHDIFDYSVYHLTPADVIIASRFLHNIKWQRARRLMTMICKKESFIMIIKYKPGDMKETGEPRFGLAIKAGVRKLCREFGLMHKSFPEEVIVCAKGRDEKLLQEIADKYGTK